MIAMRAPSFLRGYSDTKLNCIPSTLRELWLCYCSYQNTAASDVVYTIPYETAIPVTTYVSANTVYGGCPNTPTNPGGGSGSGSSNGSNNSGSTANAGSSISVPPGLTLVTSSVLVYTTGPPTTSVIPSVVTLANGQVTTTSILTTITPTPSQVLVPTTALVEATGTSSPGPDSSGNVGMIVGAVIGGFIGLCLMILAWWYVRCVSKLSLT